MGLFDFLGGAPETRFARAVTARLSARGWDGPAQYEPEHFRIAMGEGRLMNLHNAFAEWRRASPGRARDEVIEALVQSNLEIEDDWDFERAGPHLLPVVRNRTHLGLAALEMDKAQLAPANRPFSEALAIALVIDRPHGMAYVGEEQLRGWDRSFDDAYAIALDNLRAVSPAKFTRHGPLIVSDWGDFHDASRLLLPERFQDLPVKGDPVAVPVTRSIVLVTGSEDAEGAVELSRVVEDQVAQDPRAMARLPLVLRDGAWSPLTEDRTGTHAFAWLAARQKLWDYAEQKAVLDARHAADGIDVFVASLDAVQKAEDERRLTTYTVWANDVDGLLPEAEVVVLQNADGGSAARRWADVQQACAALMEPDPTLYPPRWRVRRHPGPKEWEALSAAPHPEHFPKL